MRATWIGLGLGAALLCLAAAGVQDKRDERYVLSSFPAPAS